LEDSPAKGWLFPGRAIDNYLAAVKLEHRNSFGECQFALTATRIGRRPSPETEWMLGES
jgi:hypothetical protein